MTETANYFPPSSKGSFYQAHTHAMRWIEGQPIGESFAIPKDTPTGSEDPINLRLLRTIAARLSVGKKVFVVIEHDSAFEVRRLAENEDAKEFYNFLEGKEISNLNYEAKAFEDAIKIISEYKDQKFEYIKKYDPSFHKDMQAEKVFAYSYIQRRVAALSSFRNSEKGSTETLKSCLIRLVEAGALQEVPLEFSKSNWNNAGKCFKILFNLDRLLLLAGK